MENKQEFEIEDINLTYKNEKEDFERNILIQLSALAKEANEKEYSLEYLSGILYGIEAIAYIFLQNYNVYPREQENLNLEMTEVKEDKVENQDGSK